MSNATARSNSLLQALGNLRIMSKISLGFAAAIVLSIVVAGVGHYSLSEVSESFSNYKRRVGVASAAQRIDREFLALRRHAFAYEVNGREEDAKAARERLARVTDALAQAFQLAHDPQRIGKLKLINEEAETYGKQFEKLVEMRAEQTKITVQVLDPTGTQLRVDLERIQNWAHKRGDSDRILFLAADAIANVMRVRLNANKVLSRHGADSVKRVEEAFDRLQRSMAELGTLVDDEARPIHAAVLAGIERYTVAYRKAAADAHAIQELFDGEMRRLGEAVAQNASEVLDGAVSRMREDESATTSVISRSSFVLILLSVIGVSLGSIFAWLIGRGIARPVQGMTEAMAQLAGGNHNIVVPAQGNKDEIGLMAQAVLVFRDAAIEKIRMEKEAEDARIRSAEERRRAEAEAIEGERNVVINSIGYGMEKLAAKELSFRLTDSLPDAYKKLQRDFNNAMEQLEDAMRNVRACTDTINAGTREITTASNDLSRRTEQQAATLEETTAALNEITTTVGRTAEGAKQATAMVVKARAEAQQSGDVVRRAVDAMGQIERSSQEIGQIIGVIDEIAFQTNLLALNAGVEAARAGDAGRGFAVVASEVRALAQRSAEAAKQIKALISNSSTEVGHGVKLVAETGETLERIIARVSEINAVMAEIAQNAQGQATGLQQINTAVGEMDKSTQQNAAMAEEATAASGSLVQESGQLAGLIGQFVIGGTGGGDPLRQELMKAAPHVFRTPTQSDPLRPKPAAAKAVRTSAKVAAVGGAVASPGGDDDWSEF